MDRTGKRKTKLTNICLPDLWKHKHAWIFTWIRRYLSSEWRTWKTTEGWQSTMPLLAWAKTSTNGVEPLLVNQPKTPHFAASPASYFSSALAEPVPKDKTRNLLYSVCFTGKKSELLWFVSLVASPIAIKAWNEWGRSSYSDLLKEILIFGCLWFVIWQLITTLVNVWCIRTSPNFSLIMLWRYLPLYLGPVRAFMTLVACANGQLLLKEKYGLVVNYNRK